MSPFLHATLVIQHTHCAARRVALARTWTRHRGQRHAAAAPSRPQRRYGKRIRATTLAPGTCDAQRARKQPLQQVHPVLSQQRDHLCPHNVVALLHLFFHRKIRGCEATAAQEALVLSVRRSRGVVKGCGRR